MAEQVALIGVHGGRWYGEEAGRDLAAASVVLGAERHLAAAGTGPDRRVATSDVRSLLDAADAARRDGQRVAVLVSGDPGFFGLARLAAARLGPGAIRVHPAPSSVALAFARAGLHWDDATVVSGHGRDPAPAVEAVVHAPKVAVLCGPDLPPEEVGRRLPPRTAREVVVASRLGEEGETVWRGDVGGLAAGRFDPLSVVIFLAPAGPAGPGLRWGRSEAEYQHRAGMITKAEVRAVALGKLGLPAAGVLWDVGAGSGSVAAECAALCPGLDVYAVEKREADLSRLRSNLGATAATVVAGAAPGALAGLPDPDRAFVGGGGLDVLRAVWARLRPGGTAVATFASLGRAAAAAGLLGSVVEVSVSRGVAAGPGGEIRLAAENPVFVCWGSRPP